MGSIPLVANTVNPPQQIDLLGGLSKLMAIKSAMGQQQIQQQQLQEGALDLQMKQRDLQDQQALQQAIQQNPGATLHDVLPSLAGKISAKSYFAYQQADQKLQQEFSTKTETDLKNAEAQHKMYGDIYNNVMNMPDDQVAANWPQIAQTIDSVPGNKMRLDPSRPLTKQELGQFGPMLSLNDAYLKSEAAKRAATAETSQNEAKAAAENATANEKNATAAYYLKNGGAPGVPVETQEMQDWIAKNPGKGPADFMKYKATLVPAYNFNMNAGGGGMIPGAGQPGGGQGGATPTIDAVPTSIKGTVQQILDYRGQLPPMGRNNPTNTAIRYWVNALDPQHDDTMFPARNKMMTAFTSGKESSQINAVNTALGHASVLGDAIDALNNSNIPALNAIANKIGVNIGNTPATTLQTIVHRVGPELAAAYIQGGGGEGERGTTADDFSVNKGADQLRSNLAITAKLLRSKIGSLENQYKQTMQRDDFEQRFITPEAKAALAKLSPTSSQGGTPQTHSFSLSAWQRANPQGDSDAAKAAAQAQGFQVIP